MSFPEWKKVLVVDLGFLGDTVHSVPAIRALALSGAKVDVMTTPVGAELLSLVPEVNRTWIIPLRKPSPPPWKMFASHLSAVIETFLSACITLLIHEPFGSLQLRSCDVEQLSDWYYFNFPRS